MEITTSRGHTGVAKRFLHQMKRNAAVERVAGMSVAQPVWADIRLKACATRRRTDNPPDLYLTKVAPAARAEDWPIKVGVTANGHQLLPRRRSQEDRPRLPTLAEDRDLTGGRASTLVSGLEIAPAELT